MADREIRAQDASQVLTPSIWPTGTHVRLLDVPWDSAYRDVVAWSSAEERDKWFASRAGSWFSSNFQNLRPGEPISVPVPYSSVYKYNYIVVTNPQQPVDDEGPARSYFYFITGVQYLSPQATRLTLQLDVMTTYAGAITYGNAYVDRGHIAMANSNARAKDGWALNKYFSLPEGLDVGSEYVPCAREVITINSTEHPPKIIFISTANLAADPGTTSNPSLNVADGQFVDGLPSGCNVYWVALDKFRAVMKAMKDKSWAAQCIVAIYAFPGALLTDGPSVKLFGNGPEMHFIGTTENYDIGDKPYWETKNMFSQLAEGLRPALAEDVNKLYCYPYSVIELSTLTGNPVFLKPNLVKGDHLVIQWMGCCLAPFAKAGFFAENYGDPEGRMGGYSYTYTDFEGKTKTGSIAGGDFLDTCVWLTDFPQFSFVNNAYLTYLASTTHTRDYQYSSAGWQLDRANMTANTGYRNAQRDISSQREQWSNSPAGFGSNVAQRMWSSPIIDVGGFTTPSLSDLAGMATQNASLAGWNAQNTVANATGAGSLNARLSGQSDIADNNLELARNAAKGDYQNAIAGINATVQDAALTPPSTVGQSGGQGFNWKNGLVCITVTYKTLSGASLSAVADYFRRYGYSVRRFLSLGSVRHMLCMSKFAYWRAMGASLTCADANESERETMRGIIEKGVTLWDAPESIGNTAATDNTARDGYSY
jgi:hypothetical protein|nr:MAG TPA_asm: Major tail protein [Caudoviricetes sp.]